MRIKFEIDAKKASALPFVVAWAIMLVLAGVSFLTAFLSLGPWAPVLQFSISATQAAILFVMFMRVKEGPSIKRVCAVTGFFWLLFLFGFSMTDYATRQNWPASQSPPAVHAFDGAP